MLLNDVRVRRCRERHLSLPGEARERGLYVNIFSRCRCVATDRVAHFMLAVGGGRLAVGGFKETRNTPPLHASQGVKRQQGRAIVRTLAPLTSPLHHRPTTVPPPVGLEGAGERAKGRGGDSGHVEDARRPAHGRASQEGEAVPGEGPISGDENPGGVVGIQVRARLYC